MRRIVDQWWKLTTNLQIFSALKPGLSTASSDGGRSIRTANAVEISTAATSGVAVGSGLGSLTGFNAYDALCNGKPVSEPLSP